MLQTGDPVTSGPLQRLALLNIFLLTMFEPYNLGAVRANLLDNRAAVC